MLVTNEDDPVVPGQAQASAAPTVSNATLEASADRDDREGSFEPLPSLVT